MAAWHAPPAGLRKFIRDHWDETVKSASEGALPKPYNLPYADVQLPDYEEIEQVPSPRNIRKMLPHDLGDLTLSELEFRLQDIAEQGDISRAYGRRFRQLFFEQRFVLQRLEVELERQERDNEIAHSQVTRLNRILESTQKCNDDLSSSVLDLEMKMGEKEASIRRQCDRICREKDVEAEQRILDFQQRHSRELDVARTHGAKFRRDMEAALRQSEERIAQLEESIVEKDEKIASQHERLVSLTDELNEQDRSHEKKLKHYANGLEDIKVAQRNKMIELRRIADERVDRASSQPVIAKMQAENKDCKDQVKQMTRNLVKKESELRATKLALLHCERTMELWRLRYKEVEKELYGEKKQGADLKKRKSALERTLCSTNQSYCYEMHHITSMVAKFLNWMRGHACPTGYEVCNQRFRRWIPVIKSTHRRYAMKHQELCSFIRSSDARPVIIEILPDSSPSSRLVKRAPSTTSLGSDYDPHVSNTSCFSMLCGLKWDLPEPTIVRRLPKAKGEETSACETAKLDEVTNTDDVVTPMVTDATEDKDAGEELETVRSVPGTSTEFDNDLPCIDGDSASGNEQDSSVSSDEEECDYCPEDDRCMKSASQSPADCENARRSTYLKDESEEMEECLQIAHKLSVEHEVNDTPRTIARLLPQPYELDIGCCVFRPAVFEPERIMAFRMARRNERLLRRRERKLKRSEKKAEKERKKEEKRQQRSKAKEEKKATKQSKKAEKAKNAIEMKRISKAKAIAEKRAKKTKKMEDAQLKAIKKDIKKAGILLDVNKLQQHDAGFGVGIDLSSLDLQALGCDMATDGAQPPQMNDDLIVPITGVSAIPQNSEKKLGWFPFIPRISIDLGKLRKKSKATPTKCQATEQVPLSATAVVQEDPIVPPLDLGSLASDTPRPVITDSVRFGDNDSELDTVRSGKERSKKISLFKKRSSGRNKGKAKKTNSEKKRRFPKITITFGRVGKKSKAASTEYKIPSSATAVVEEDRIVPPLDLGSLASDTPRPVITDTVRFGYTDSEPDTARSCEKPSKKKRLFPKISLPKKLFFGKNK